jgi:hypothetical protein
MNLKAHGKPGFFFSLLLLTAVSCFLFGCSAAPSEHSVKKLIIKYFEDKIYRVIKIDMGEIRAMPMGEKQYMGTPGYDVDVTAISLEVLEDTGEPWSYKKGQKIMFSNASIRIKQRSVHDKDWIIANIQGIAVP